MTTGAGFWEEPARMPLARFIGPRAWTMLAVAAVLSFAPLLRAWYEGAAEVRVAEPAQPAAWRYLAALALLGLSASALATSGFNPFIYFRF